MYVFSLKSQDRLNTCTPDLVRLFNEVIKHRDCKVICGRRDAQAQFQAYKNGYSKKKYPNSYHNRFPSQAADVTPHPLDWDDIEGFKAFGNFVLGVAAVMEINIEWGGRFEGFFDGAHYQIPE